MDFRPVAYVLGHLFAALGVAMLPSAGVDWLEGKQSPVVFGLTGLATLVFGMALVVATRNSDITRFDVRQAFLLTASAWFLLPFAAAIPFMAGAPGVSLTLAYFEAASGFTTTGTTAFQGLDALPMGTNLWRHLIQWLGGLGIIIVALIFLPVMRVGGMQFFRSEGFDTLGKVLPRATDISTALLQVYVILTIAAWAAFYAAGQTGFEALCHAFAAVSTGGFSTRDASFIAFPGAPEYVGMLFMIAGTLPFIRYVQLLNGHATPLWQDVQVRTYLRWMLYAIALVAGARLITEGGAVEEVVRNSAFYTVSMFSGTGFTNGDPTVWGTVPFVVLICVGLIGGCTASTGCSIKVFRWMVLIEMLKVQIRLVQSPNAVLRPRLGGKVIEQDVIDGVILFFTVFMLTFGVLIVALSMTGLPFLTAVTSAWTAIANVGPAFGAPVSGTGSVDAFPATALWLMSVAMILGRIELLAAYVLLMPRFWRV
ncbi:MAG: TrkH family potassium uptake protein [Rhodobacteraceae bacterium]|jgi:trk system potassium uptake protein TrkH|nr:TrkH family potassium uptake protein [Paracoccaceae bacterium]